jgi:uncharacterized protein YijF (DUF1287 family)
MRRMAFIILSLLTFILIAGCGESKKYTERNTEDKLEVSSSYCSPTPRITNTPVIISTPLPTPLYIPRLICTSDKDKDGINDLDDIVEGARKDADNRPVYKSEYYKGGYPPDNEGVCTDVIWRALKNAGYNLKDMIDSDIKANTKSYPGVEGKPDPNIDFRRVRNLYVFFKKYGTSVTTSLIPNDIENLKQWQGGDIVTFTNPEHIAIVSDKRRDDGVPYLIHNAGPYTMEVDNIMTWMPGITGHFRFPKN